MAWSAVGDFSGTAYRPPQIHNLPSHNSKTVLSIVKIGPPFFSLRASAIAFCLWAVREPPLLAPPTPDSMSLLRLCPLAPIHRKDECRGVLKG